MVLGTLGDPWPSLPKAIQAALEHPRSPPGCPAGSKHSVLGSDQGSEWHKKGYSTGGTRKKVGVSQVLAH